MEITQRQIPRRFVAGFALASILLALFGLTEDAAASTVTRTSAALPDYVDAFIDSIPRRDSEAYVVPTATDAAAFGQAVKAAVEGRLATASSLAAPFGYGVVELRDPVDGRRYVLLREKSRADGTRARNWGLYVLRTNWLKDLVVEVAHPLYDIDSHRVGMGVFQRSQGRALFVAGAHRYANADHLSDVAHAPVSAFEYAHRALVRPGATVYQPHGFAESLHPEYGDVVVSGGVAPAPARAVAVADALRPLFSVCLFDGSECSDFGATTNVQGRSARAAGASFVHVEHVRRLRSDPLLRSEVVVRTVRGLR